MTALSQTYHVQTITTEDGLISNQVNSVTQDQSGQLWISTIKGLTRYDGLNWYQFPDTLILPNSTDTRLANLSDGRILIAGHKFDNSFAAFIISSNTAEEIDIPESNLSRKIWTVTKQDRQEFFHLYFNGVLHSYSLQDKNWEALRIPTFLADKVNTLRSLDNELHFLTKEGIYKVASGELKRIMPETVSEVVMDIMDVVKTDSALYILGRKWVGKLQDESLTVFINHSQESVIYNALKLSQRGFLFFRSETRFEWYHIPTGDHLRFAADNDDAIPQNSTLFIDKENNLWITSYRGLHKLNSFQFLGITPSSGLLEYEVSAIIETGKDSYFIGGQRSYAIIENGSIVYRSFVSQNPQARTRMISVTKTSRKGNPHVYVAAQDLGIGELQSNREMKWHKLPVGGAELVACVRDTVFVSNSAGTFYTFINGKFEEYAKIYAYPRNMYAMDDGSSLVCASSGVRIIKGNEVRTITVRNNLLLRSVYCMFIHEGTTYLGTDAGLAKLQDDKIIPATLFGRGISNPLYAVNRVNDTEYWFGSDIGTIVVDKSEVKRLGDLEGLLGTEINRRAFIRSSTGDILIGTNKGLNLFDPKMEFEQVQAFPPEILNMEVGGDSIAYPWKSLELSPRNNNLRINFRSITFGKEPVSFRYRLIGLEDDWSELESRDIRQVQYRSLPPGTYHFELSSRIGKGSWSTSVLSPPFLLKRPFYTSWPFFVILFLVAVGSGFIVNKIATEFTSNKKLKQIIQSKIKEIELNEAKLQLALQNSKMGVWTYNFSSKEIEQTPQIFEILNISDRSSPMSISEYSELIHPSDRLKISESLTGAIESRHSFDVEIRMKIANESYRWMSVKGRCLFHDNGDPSMLSGTLADIHERKQYESDREKLITELEQTNRELDRFVYSASHDLSAPMKSVMGLINLARMNASPSEIQNYLALIDKSVRKQDEFIREIISFARNSRTEVIIELIDLTDIIDETLSNLKYADQYSKSEFDIQIPDNCKTIPGDRTRLKIVLNNLLSNAIKFQRRNSEKHVVSIHTAQSNGGFMIRIEDNGEGIHPDHREKIFDMFYRGTDNAPGSGLGLYIAKEAAEKMGGKIDVESTYGQGSRFIISLVNHSNGLSV